MPDKTNSQLRDLTKPVPTSGTISLTPQITIPVKQYQELKKYLTNRIRHSWQYTKARADTYDKIDTQLLGAIFLSKEDLARARENQKGKSPKVTDINLAVGQAQIDTCVTSLINLLVPTNDMYEAYTVADKQALAQGLAYEMSDHADKFGHITEIHKALVDVLKYDLCGLLVEWKNVQGNKISNDALGGPSVVATTVYSGNKLQHLDMRNTFYPPHISPEDVCTRGQYVGYVTKIDNFEINEMIDEAEIYGAYVPCNAKVTNTIVAYNPRPDLQNPATQSKYKNSDGTTNFDALFASNVDTVGSLSNLITMYCRIRPAEFGLSDSYEVSIWKFRFLNDEIVYASQLTNAHGNLPVVMSSASLDGLDDESPSYAEYLIPLQNFCSYLVNVKQRAYRKQMYGINFYDRDRVDMREALNKGDSENMWIPVNGQGNAAIATFVQHYNDAPDTNNIMADIANVKQLMQDLLPTDSRTLLANLNRATQWQAQKTASEADKRTMKIARLLNQTLLSPLKSMQVYNILQYKDVITVLRDTGQYEDIRVADLRDLRIDLGISSALRGIDKDLLAERFREMLALLIQIPHLTSDYDITWALDYWSSLVGADIDLSQFRVQSPFDKLTPEQKQAAYQLLIQATATQQAQTTVDSAISSMPPLTSSEVPNA